MSHAKKKKIAIIALSATAALLAAGTISGVLYSHSKDSKKGKENNKLPEIQDINELEKKIEAIRDSHKQNLKSEAWKILEALKITIRNDKKANNVRDLSQVISDFERLIPLAEAYLGEIKKLPELKALAEELATTIDLSKETLKEAKDKLKTLQDREAKLKEDAKKLLEEIEKLVAKEPTTTSPLAMQALINKLKDLQNASEALQKELNNYRLIEDAKKLSDANLKIKDAINRLQDRLAKDPEELKKLTDEKISNLTKSKKAVEDANNINDLPNALESLKKDIEAAKKLKEQTDANALSDLSSKLENAIKDAEGILKAGETKKQEIEKTNQEIKDKIDALVEKIKKDAEDVNGLTSQSKDSDFSKLKDTLEKDIQDATDLAKKAADATLLEHEDKALDAKKKVQNALDKLNELFNQKKEQELAKAELEKAYSALVSATEDVKKANDENTLPLAISKLEAAISSASTSLDKYETLKAKELLKPIYGVLEKSLETATKTLEDAKKRLESKKQEKAKIDAELKQRQDKFDAIEKTIEAASTINDIPALQNTIKELGELKTETKATETAAKNASYPEAESKAKKLLENIAKLEIEANAKLEKLKEEKERQEQEKRIIDSLRDKLEKITKNLEILDSRGTSQLRETNPKQTELAKTLDELKEQLKEANDVKEEIKGTKKEGQLKAELEALDDAITKANQTKQAIETKISASNNAIKKQIYDARETLKTLTKNAKDQYDAKKLDELKEAIKKLESLENEAKNIESLADAVESIHKQDAYNLTKDIRDALLDANTKLSELRSQKLFEELENQIKAQEKTLKDAQNEANNANTIDDRKDKYGKLDKVIENIRENIKNLEEAAKKLEQKADKDKLDQKIKNLNGALDDAKKDLAQKQKQLQSDKKQNTEETDALLKETDKTLKEADEAIKNPSNKDEVKKVEDALNKAKTGLEKKKGSLVGDSENQRKIDEKLEEIVQKQQKLNNAKEKQQQSEDERAKALANEAKRLKGELEDLVNKLNPYDASSDYEKKIKNVEDKIKELKEGFLEADSEASKLKDNPHLKQAYEDLEIAKDSAKTKAKGASDKIIEAKDTLKANYENLKTQTEQAKAEFDDADTDEKLNKLKDKIGIETENKLLGQVKKLLEGIAKFDDLDKLKQDTKKLETDLMTLLEDIAKKLTSLADKIAKLNKNLKAATNALGAQDTVTKNVNKTDIDSLTAQIKKLAEQIEVANKAKTAAEKERVKDSKIQSETKAEFDKLVKALEKANKTLANKKVELQEQTNINNALTEDAIQKSAAAIAKINAANKLEDTDTTKISSLSDALNDANAAKEALQKTKEKLEKDAANKQRVEGELQKLESEIANAQSKLEVLKEGESKKLEQIKKDLENIKNDLDNANKNFDSKTDLKDKEEANEALKAAINKAKKDLQVQKNKVNTLQEADKKAEANTKIKEIEDLIKTLTQKQQDKAAEISAKRTQNGEKTTQAIQKADEALKKAKDAIEKDKNDSTKETDLNDAKSELEKQKNILENLSKNDLKDDSENRAKIDSKTTEIDKKLQEIDNAQKALKQSQDQRATELAIEAKKLQDALEKLANELKPETEQWSQTRGKISQIEQKVKEIEEGFLKANGEANKLKNNSKLKPAYDALVKAIETVKAKAKAASDKIAQAKTNLESNYENLKSQTDQAKTELDDADTKDKLNALKDKIGIGTDSKLLNKVKDLIKEINQFEPSGTLLTNAKALEAELNNLLEKIQEKLISLTAKIQKLKEDLKNVAEALNGQNTTTKNVSDDNVDSLIEETKKLQDQIAAATAIKNDAEAKRNQNSQIKTDTQSEFDNLASALNNATATLAAKKAALTRKQAQNDALVENLIQKSSEAKKALADANKLANNHPDKIKNLDDAITKATEAKKALENAINSLAKDSANKKKVEVEFQDLNTKIADAQNKLKILREGESKKLEQIKKDLDKIKNDLDNANKNFDAKIDLNDKEEANKALKDAIDKATSDLQKQKNEANKIQEDAKKLEANQEIKTIQDLIASLTKKYQDKQKEIKQTKDANKKKANDAIARADEALNKANEALGKSNDDANKESDLNGVKSKLEDQKNILENLSKNDLKDDSENKAKIDRKIQNIKDKLSEIDQAKKDLKQSQDDKAKELALLLRERKQELEWTLDDLDVENKKWVDSERNIHNIRLKIGEANFFLDPSKSEIGKQVDRLKDNKHLKEIYDELKLAINKATDAIKKAEDSIKRKKVEFEEKIKAFETKKNLLASDVQSNNVTVKRLKEIIEEIGDNNKGLLKEINDLVGEISKFEQPNGLFETRLDGIRIILERVIDTANKKLKEINQQVLDITNSLAKKRQSIEKIDSIKVDTLTTELENLQKLIDQAESLENKINTLDNDYQELTKEARNNLKKEIKEAKATITSATKRKDEQIQKNIDSVKEFEKKLKEYEAKLIEAKKIPSTPEITKYEAIKQIYNKTRELQNELIQITQNLADHKQQLIQLQKLTKRTNDLVSETSGIWADLRDQLMSLMSGWRLKMDPFNISYIKSIKELEELKNNITSLLKRVEKFLQDFLAHLYDPGPENPMFPGSKPAINKSYGRLKDYFESYKNYDYVTAINQTINSIKTDIANAASEADSLLNKGFAQSEVDVLKANIKNSDSVKEAQEKLDAAKQKSSKLAQELINQSINNLTAQVNNYKNEFETNWVSKIGSSSNSLTFIDDFNSEINTYMTKLENLWQNLATTFAQKHFKLDDPTFASSLQGFNDIKSWFTNWQNQVKAISQMQNEWRAANIPNPNKNHELLKINQTNWSDYDIEQNRATLKSAEQEFTKINNRWNLIVQYRSIAIEFYNKTMSWGMNLNEFPDEVAFWTQEIPKWKTGALANVGSKNIRDFWLNELSNIYKFVSAEAFFLNSDEFNKGNLLLSPEKTFGKYTQVYAAYAIMLYRGRYSKFAWGENLPTNIKQQYLDLDAKLRSIVSARSGITPGKIREFYAIMEQQFNLIRPYL
ncbi:Flagellar biosynthesis regulator FlbT [Metamycoplasma arthritidis]|uniref:Massive surface protein MspF n=1 Tax=Metamycoplasma arthritidis (strain 158L3-1) TaxID=243272 RepID=B3PMR7_META1|nr:massive surface protein MspF [Metamycoplasma arthritidis]ACF07319.1 massive surface protein MspF [Metamycoplasma arthritidis 158L3-1]VEU78842.1 Flagellar biosynthesis regulator FlbT [Metamycoplasma arthritidis]